MLQILINHLILLSSKFVNSNIAEIYLNGNRIAYIPVGQDKSFYKSIKTSIHPSPKTVYDLALIENDGDVEAFDLRSAMQAIYNPKLVKGDRLFIFEDKFFNATNSCAKRRYVCYVNT